MLLTKLINLEASRKSALIAAGLAEFSRRGYDDASTNRIAVQAGISKNLMFHYINSKKEFFLFLYDDCFSIINEQYVSNINLEETDIFRRLRNIYMEKIKFIRAHPLVFSFLYKSLFIQSPEIADYLKQKEQSTVLSSFQIITENIDSTSFRDDLDVEKCKQLIVWSINGYGNQVLAAQPDANHQLANIETVRIEFDGFLHELEKAFYKKEVTL